MAEAELIYGWSKHSVKRYHRVRRLNGSVQRFTSCGLWVEQYSLDKAEVPTSLTACPKCFKAQIGERQKEETEILIAKTQILVDFMDEQGILPEHNFTFNDGETWWATGHGMQ